MSEAWTAYGEPLHPGMGPELPDAVYEFLARGAALLGGPIHAPVIPDGGLPSEAHRDWLLEHDAFTVLGSMEEPAPHPELAPLTHWAGLLALPQGDPYRTLVLTILTPVQDGLRGPKVLSPWPRVVVVERWDDLPERFTGLAARAAQAERA